MGNNGGAERGVCADAWRMKNHLPLRLSGERLESTGGGGGVGAITWG